MPRLRPVVLLAAVLVVLVPAGGATGRTRAPSPRSSVVDLVNTFVGTAPSAAADPVPGGTTGDTFPGASLPFGEVQWSPDTPNAENPAGYNYGDTTLLGFSLTHFSGAGCANSGLFRFLPTPGDDGSTPPGFDHADESAGPGWYQVGLANGIGVQLAATTRGGLGTFAFPAGSTPTVVLDATTTDPYAPAGEDGVHAVDDHTLEGSEIHGNFCGSFLGYRMYVHAEFDTPFTVVPTASPTVARVQFPAGTTEVKVRVAVSPVSTDNAAANRAAEVPGWDRATVRDAGRARWDELLGRVQVTGGSDAQRRTFYTALYHSLLHPSTFSDVNGQYPGFDGAIHTMPPGHVHYHTFSGWDIYRSQVQLLAVLVPDVATDIQATLLANAQACGGGFDQWSLGNVEAHVMVGDPGAQMVANLDAFGIAGADPAGVLEVMRRSALDPNTSCMVWPLRPGLQGYLDRGYVSGEVSRTLEYAMADAGIAQYAERHGDPSFADLLVQHARNWQTQLNSDSGYVQPRNDDGSWAPWSGPASTDGYVEGNAAQYTWMIPQDYGHLVQQLGGRDAAMARLDSLFEKVNAGVSEPHFYIGNEPQFGVPWAYVWAGAPSHTQDAVRRVIDEVFSDGPGGLPGNDDLGATSSWLVWASLGMFPVVPGQDVLVLNTPLFPSVTVDVPGRSPLTITAPGAPDQRYVASARLDGSSMDRAWLRWSDLEGGGQLDFALSDGPTSWGAAPGLEPPSLADAAVPPTTEPPGAPSTVSGAGSVGATPVAVVARFTG